MVKMCVKHDEIQIKAIEFVIAQALIVGLQQLKPKVTISNQL